jgi:hypothetical protein
MVHSMSPADPPAPSRRFAMVAVAVPADTVTRPLFGRHGFAVGAIVTDWPAIVGSAIATHALPIRIRFPGKERSGGTLHIKVASGAFALELQHLEPLILERINGYFGWKAVDRLRMVQGPLPEPHRRPPPPPPAEPPANAAFDARLAGVEDPDLRAVLARLGHRLVAGKSGA